MLTRNLLCTAVSRASRALVLVGQRVEIALGLRRAEDAAGFSRLPALLDGRSERPARSWRERASSPRVSICDRLARTAAPAVA